MMQDNAIGRILGDLFTAQSQLFVRDSAYENLGRLRLGFTDQAPLGPRSLCLPDSRAVRRSFRRLKPEGSP